MEVLAREERLDEVPGIGADLADEAAFRREDGEGMIPAVHKGKTRANTGGRLVAHENDAHPLRRSAGDSDPPRMEVKP